MSQDPDKLLELVTVDRFFHPTEAHIAAGLLESEGIPVHLFGIHHASVNWLVTPALGGIQIKVPRRYARQARELLAENRALDEPEPPTCPACGSTDVHRAMATFRLSFLAMHLLNIPLPWRADRLACRSCHHKFEATD